MMRNQSAETEISDTILHHLVVSRNTSDTHNTQPEQTQPLFVEML